jgi:exonuclease VII small subunit
MELAFAIIGIGFIVVMIILYMEARRDVKDYREQVNSLRKNIDRLNSNKSDLETELSELRRGRSLSDPATTWVLTQDLVGDALKYNGYQVEQKEKDFYTFIVNEERYIALLGRLPFVQLRITFSLGDEWDMEILKKAAAVSNPQTFMSKVSVDVEDRSFMAFIDLYEPAYGHFRDCLPAYLKALDAARISACETYDKLKEESKKEQETEPKENEIYSQVLNDKSLKSTMPS